MDPKTEAWTLTLDRYQRDNLLALLALCGALREEVEPLAPFTLANTGDWLKEVAQMLAEPGLPATMRGATLNVSLDSMRRCVREWLEFACEKKKGSPRDNS